MNQLPETGYIRLKIILGDKKSIPPLIPICKSTWWEGVKAGRFPKPIKLGARITVWRVEDIRQLIDCGDCLIKSKPKNNKRTHSPRKR